jgi:hypothetical protein
VTSTAIATRPAPVSTQPARRAAERRDVAIPGRLTWRDASGTLRFVSVMTRDVSEFGVFVECLVPASISMYRLVHFQVERSARDLEGLPAALQHGKVLAAVYRLGPYQTETGTPAGYALRLLVDPERTGVTNQEPLAAAN